MTYTGLIAGSLGLDQLTAYVMESVLDSHGPQRKDAVLSIVKYFVQNVARRTLWLRHHQERYKVMKEFVIPRLIQQRFDRWRLLERIKGVVDLSLIHI